MLEHKNHLTNGKYLRNVKNFLQNKLSIQFKYLSKRIIMIKMMLRK